MKSSTIRRSGLSKASMDVIENLANEAPIEYSQNVEPQNDYAPSEYYRETEKSSVDNKSKEIDLLWQTFKSAQFNTNSPFMNILGGFILGVITTVLTISIFGMFVANSDNASLKTKFSIFTPKTQLQKIDDTIESSSDYIKEQNIPTDEVDIPVAIPENTVKTPKKSEKKVKTVKTEKVEKIENTEAKTPVNAKKYIIKEGDTVEAIIIRNYGSYTSQRAQAIMEANNLKDLDHISIDQELLLPIEK